MKVLTYLSNSFHVVFSMLFYPTKRFDEINGSTPENYESLRGHIAEVLQPVSCYAGAIRYSGARKWEN